jgi:hypothetical protein
VKSEFDTPNILGSPIEQVKSGMQIVWDQILRAPIIGGFIFYAVYLFTAMIWVPVFASLCGGQRLKFGRSVFWIPRQKAQVVRDGLALLRSRDPEMFFWLTRRHRLVIYYFDGPKWHRKSGHRLFFMHSKFVDWGPQGVACFVVQSLMLAAAALQINQSKLVERGTASPKSISRDMAEWLSRHAFHPKLISTYRQLVENQERDAGAA